ncbi:DUF1015 domain-containing protein [Enterococcus cecorum]|uniref:DUF1015 domain-containing protein n=1 Tax=Enterococcus cecorum TaxID=44008 RepID=UPI001FACBC67|nr:DUF1015 family protein [Enterococcus cecorum]MCJ0537530.1 DUF1015 family protein [Enterococcus cecorum]MCJ0545434.1 DUF1015 family protein [Enterococcus cecorum]MCJ0550257.1 DUF1015 family protein [Enterococcus cecorum]MCJ0568124.1 DUF1015 family protein [Enterococcus cecorum]
MVDVQPFRAIRPNEQLASQVACLPYDVIDTNEARVESQDNPYSYYHIDRSEIAFDDDFNPYDPKVYELANQTLQQFLQKGWLKKEDKPCFYLYELTMDGRKQTGIAASTSIDDYVNDQIKKHEFTRPAKEQDRINHIKACDANTSPIFLSYRQPQAMQHLVEEWKANHAPVYDFTKYHGVTHRLWVVDDEATVTQMVALFAQVPALYIADGHHRAASAVKVGLEKRAQGQSSAESDYFLSIIFPEQELKILEYNRVINVTPPADFLERLAKIFTIQPTSEKKSQQKGEFKLYFQNQWYTLTLDESLRPTDAVEGLDVAVLQKYVIEDIFGIMDVRTDARIDFVGGIRGSEELARLVDSGAFQVAFALYPTSMQDLLAVADDNQIMPPKSTWFEPKLLSGLLLHDLETR